MDEIAIKNPEFGFLTNSNPPPDHRKARTPEPRMPATDVVDLIEAALAALPGRRVLDIGCGDGDFLSECRDRGMVCAGWEGAPALAKAAAAKGFRVASGDLGEFLSQAEGGRFDAVNVNALSFVKNPAQALVNVRENLLADRGVVAVCVPNAFTPLQRAAAAELGLGEWWARPGALNHFTGETLVDLLEGCAFAVEGVFADLPRELFLLAEPRAARPLQSSLARKRRFWETARKRGLHATLKGLSLALGRLGLGDHLVALARPDAFSKPCESRVLKQRGQ